MIIEKAILISLLSVSLVVAMYETYAEKKWRSNRDRRGPNRAVLWNSATPG
jgi:hypothetical protein